MNNWKVHSLSDICSSISYGYTESASSIEIGPKFLRITDIASGIINWENVPYCKISDSDLLKYKLHPGDIVIARTGASTGANYIVKDDDPEGVVFASYLIRYRIDSDIAFPFFIGHVLNSRLFQDYVDSIAGGSAQPGANAKLLGSFTISLPPLSTQKAIAEVLSSLDDKIDLLHRQNKTLEQMAETLFRQWFVEEAKEDWEEGCLGDVIDIYDNKRIPLSKMERDKMKTGTLYPYYGAAKVMDYVNEYIFDGEYILLGEDGTVQTEEGYPVLQYATGKFWVNNHAHVITAKKPYNNFFIWNFLSKLDITNVVTGAVQPKINQSNLKAIRFPKYPEQKVLDFNKTTSELFKKVNFNKSQINNLSSMRDTLLPKLISGEVHVKV